MEICKILKIYCHENGNKQTILHNYYDLPSFQYHILSEALQIPDDDFDNYKLFWIDSDGDEINLQDNFDILEHLMKNTSADNIIKISVRPIKKEIKPGEKESNESVVKTTEIQKTTEDDPDEPLPEHPEVNCDSCGDVDIEGFRYKCIQCEDYDLCRHCEAKMVHDHHLMIRIPIGLEPETLKLVEEISLDKLQKMHG